MTQKNINFALLILRLVVSVIFIYHGLLKFSNTAGIAQAVGMSSGLVSVLGFIELLAGLFLILGILVQYASVVLALIMVGAIYFKIFVWQVPFVAAQATGWEFDLILLAANLALVLTKGGILTILKNKSEQKDIKADVRLDNQDKRNISEESLENKSEEQVQ